MKRFAWCSAMAASLCLGALSSRSAAARPANAIEADAHATDQARARYDRGVELFKEGDYRAALIEFQRAYELIPNYRVLYNIGQVYYQLQDYANALVTLEQYLEEGGNRISKKRRRSVRDDLAKLRPRVARLEVEVNVAGAEILVDDVSVGYSPLDEPLTVSAGRRKVTVLRAGRDPVTKHVDVAGSETAAVDFDLSGSGPPDDSALEPGDGDGDTAAPSDGDVGSRVWIGWVVTGALATGALITGVLALESSSDLEQIRAGQTTREELDDAASQTLGLSIATDVLLGATVVAGGLSLVLTILELSGSDETSTAEAARRPVFWSVGPTGVLVGGRF